MVMFVVLVVFVGVFTVLALLLYASDSGESQRNKQTMANLQSVLTVNTSDSRDQMVDVRRADALSAVPWINRWLMTLEIAPRLRTLLFQANLSWTAGRLIVLVAAFAIVPGYLIYWRTGSFLLALLLGLVFGGFPFVYVFQKRRKRFNAFEQGLPEALDLMVGGLRAGHSLVAALRLVAHESPDPIGSEFRICFDEQNYGLELRTALENLCNRMPMQDLRIVATAILIQKESGGNLAEVLDKVAAVIRDRFRLKRQIRVYTAQGRLTGMILSVLPIVLGFLLYMVNPETMSVLWTRPIGLKLLYAAGIMTIAGGLIIRKIVNMEV